MLDFPFSSLDNVCPEGSDSVTNEQAAEETRYQLARCVFLRLYNDGVAEVAQKYRSIIGELEVNSIAGENGYKD